MGYFIYAIYNLFSLAVIVWVLLFMNTFVNQMLIPAVLKKSFALEMLMRFLVANLEGGIMILLVYLLNRSYASHFFVADRRSNFVSLTALAAALVIVILTAFFAYGIYRKGL